MTNTEPLFDTPLTDRVLRARAEAVRTDGYTDAQWRDTVRDAHREATAPAAERVITIPWPVALLAALLIAAALFGAGFLTGAAAGIRTTHTAPVSHTVSCQVAGGPACTRDAVLDPAGTN